MFISNVCIRRFLVVFGCLLLACAISALGSFLIAGAMHDQQQDRELKILIVFVTGAAYYAVTDDGGTHHEGCVNAANMGGFIADYALLRGGMDRSHALSYVYEGIVKLECVSSLLAHGTEGAER